MPQRVQVHTLYKPTVSLALGVVDGKTKSVKADLLVFRLAWHIFAFTSYRYINHL